MDKARMISRKWLLLQVNGHRQSLVSAIATGQKKVVLLLLLLPSNQVNMALSIALLIPLPLLMAKFYEKNGCAMGPVVAPPSSSRTTRQRTTTTIKRRSRPGHVSKRHCSSSSDESFVNSPSPPPEPSSTDSDVPPRQHRRSTTIPLPQVDPATTPAATVTPLSDHVDAQLDEAIATTSAQTPDQQAASLTSLLDVDPLFANLPTNPHWLKELDARRESARKCLNHDASQPLPWHMAIVLANKHFAPEIIQQIQQFPVTWEPPVASSPKLVPHSPEVGHKPSPNASIPDVVSASRRNSDDESAYETRTDEDGNQVRVRRRPALPTGAVLVDAAAPAIPPADDAQLPTSSP